MANKSSVLKNLSEIVKKYNASLIAISKTKSPEHILELYAQGQKVFGENRVQELVDKYQTLPKDITWHMVGHLQRNKIKYIAPFVHLIHSVDSVRLFKEIEKEGKKNHRQIPVLIQLKIAQEETKSGLLLDQMDLFFSSDDVRKASFVKILGVMGMSSFVPNPDHIRNEFRLLKENFDYIKRTYFPADPDFQEISMGMSGDYQIALEEGSTMVRIGSLLFGPR